MDDDVLCIDCKWSRGYSDFNTRYLFCIRLDKAVNPLAACGAGEKTWPNAKAIHFKALEPLKSKEEADDT